MKNITGSNIERQARKLHTMWLAAHRDYVEDCRNKPRIMSQSHDFHRAVAWKDLPEHWKSQYRREARIALLTSG